MSSARPLVLVTRPAAAGAALAEELEALGYAVWQEPLLEITPLEFALPEAGALIITSSNALLRAESWPHEVKAVPLFVVGEETAARCCAAGFTQVQAVAEDGARLVPLIAAAKPSGVVAHLTSAHTETAFGAALREQGVAYTPVLAYTAQAAAALSAGLKQALQENRLQATLFFSARTAALFAQLAQDLSAPGALALCLSERVAAACAPDAWKAVESCAAPTQAALLALLQRRIPA